MAGPAGDKTIVIRRACEVDADEMRAVEATARGLLLAHGVDLDALDVSEGFQEPTTWSLAFVAEAGGEVVGMARLTELDSEVLSLDQISVRPDFAHRGVGTRLLAEVEARARQLGYKAITGTTFREIPFNAPFYAKVGGVEDTTPHPEMLERRRVEQALGLDRLGPRVIMRVSL